MVEEVRLFKCTKCEELSLDIEEAEACESRRSERHVFAVGDLIEFSKAMVVEIVRVFWKPSMSDDQLHEAWYGAKQSYLFVNGGWSIMDPDGIYQELELTHAWAKRAKNKQIKAPPVPMNV